MRYELDNGEFKQGITDNQSVEEIDEIVEQIKAVTRLRKTGDRLLTGTDKYIIEIRKIK